MTRPDAVTASLILLGLVWAGHVLAGHDLTLWYDEVFTLGAAGVGADGPDWATLRRDVHPPTHVLLVHFASGLGPPASPEALRLVNLLALVPLALAARLVHRAAGGTTLALAALGLATGGFVFLFTLELRVYGLLLAAAAFGQAALLARLAGPGGDRMIATAAVLLASLHFFGAALGAALAATSALLALGEGRRARAAAMLGLALGIGAATLVWAFVIGDVRGALGGGLWIRNGIGPWLDLAANQPLLVIWALALALLARRGVRAERAAARRALWTLLPPAMVLAVALAVSLHSPVISAKNLSVTLPAIALALALATPPAMAATLRRSPALPAVVAVFALTAAWTTGRNLQYIRWTVETATPAACAGVPLYVIDPDIVDSYAQRVFLGRLARPPVNLRGLPEGVDLDAYRGACDVVAAGFHEDGPATAVADLLAARGLPVTIEQAPDPRARAAAAMRMGFVARRAAP